MAEPEIVGALPGNSTGIDGVGFESGGGFGDAGGKVPGMSDRDKKTKREKKQKKVSKVQDGGPFPFGPSTGGDFGTATSWGVATEKETATSWGVGDDGGSPLGGGLASSMADDPFTTVLAEDRGSSKSRAKSFAALEFGGSSPDASQEQLRSVSVQFESIIAADHEVCRQLRREVDELQDEMRHMRELGNQVQGQLQQQREDQGRLASQHTTLESRLNEARRRLTELRDSRRVMNLESLSLRRDRNHCEEELGFLKRMSDDEAQSLEVARRANILLERSCLDLEGHASALEAQRRVLAQQVHQEQEMVRKEERSNAELRNKLGQLRRQRAIKDASRREAEIRQRQIREMQGAGRFAPGGRSMLEPDKEHSWAQTLVGSRSAAAA